MSAKSVSVKTRLFPTTDFRPGLCSHFPIPTYQPRDAVPELSGATGATGEALVAQTRAVPKLDGEESSEFGNQLLQRSEQLRARGIQ